MYRLWHYQMGHMSDRGLTELSRRGMITALKKEDNDLFEPYIFNIQYRVKFINSTKHIV